MEKYRFWRTELLRRARNLAPGDSRSRFFFLRRWTHYLWLKSWYGWMNAD